MRRQLQWCSHCLLPSKPHRYGASVRRGFIAGKDGKPPSLAINGKSYRTDDWTNTSSSIVAAVGRQLHLQPQHPLSITRQLIELQFPGYAFHNRYHPVVSVDDNFDSLHFPADHPGRSRSDTYYVNSDTVLRTHTSAHQRETFKQNESDGWLIAGDVYRRDAIDRSHYPVFHQMEGARTWDRASYANEHDTLVSSIKNNMQQILQRSLDVDDPAPTTDPEHNPRQEKYHSEAEVEAIAAHLKRSLETMVVGLFSRAQDTQQRLKVRWVPAYFPFTSPSWELELFWQGSWLEVLGCGIVKQELLIGAGVPSRIGWAFGLGLERLAMVLFSIPDIRLFWSQDSRFLSQFADLGHGQAEKSIRQFESFSKYPPCLKDVSFWVEDDSSRTQFHENEFMELVRDTAGGIAEEVKLIDEFFAPATGRRSRCYRINYRSHERTLTNEETNSTHARVTEELARRFSVTLR